MSLLAISCVACGPEPEAAEEACPGQPRLCEPFTFVREDDGLSLRSAFEEDSPAPPSDVHCVLKALRDGTPSAHTFTDGFPTVHNDAGAVSRSFRVRDIRVFEDGHVELTDSATENFEDPATPQPRRAHFVTRPDAFFVPCLASNDPVVLRDCLWAFEDEEVPESGCRAPVGVPSRGGEPGTTSGE